MDKVGVNFRLTRDLDIVLCVEVLDKKFAKAFWAFVKDAGYQNQQRSTGKKNFYRFDKPSNNNYPTMLELFSRKPDTLITVNDSHLTPIPVDDDVSSLSAILLDDDYYAFIQDNIIDIDGISVVNERCLIPLKAKAWLDLSARKLAGEKIDSKVIKKHKNDIFRLFQILLPDERAELSGTIANDLNEFLDEITKEQDTSLKDLGLSNYSKHEVIELLKKSYIFS